MEAKRHSREGDRLRALRAFDVLDTEPDPLFDELVGLATELLDVPTALVGLVDEQRRWFKARVGLERHETSLEESFRAQAGTNARSRTGEGYRVLVVDDSRDLVDALARLLNRHGYETAVAGTAEAALALATRAPVRTPRPLRRSERSPSGPVGCPRARARRRAARRSP